MLGRLEDANFEDWLTAALIENANQRGPADDLWAKDDDVGWFGFTDLWMLEIAERKGKIWTGNFRLSSMKQMASGRLKPSGRSSDPESLVSPCIPTRTKSPSIPDQRAYPRTSTSMRARSAILITKARRSVERRPFLKL